MKSRFWMSLALLLMLPLTLNAKNNKPPANSSLKQVKTPKKATTNKVDAVIKKPFCWKISKGKSTLYLLGSIHVGVPEMFPMAKSVEDAFARSKYLMVEVDPSKINQLELMPLMTYTPPDSLEKHITAKTYKKIIDMCTPLGLPKQAIDQLRPGAICATIAVLEMAKLGYDPKYGIDQYFINKVKAPQKILEFESAKFQLDLINSLGESMLDMTIDENDQAEEDVKKMIGAWESGDANKMAKVVLDGFSKYPELNKKFLADRNVKMVQKMTKAMARKGEYFVVVGAAHLVGPDGILKAFKKAGKYKIEQMK